MAQSGDSRELRREILLAFWKVHILHHAATKPVVGQWMMKELREHGYEISPGTLYPVLARMEQRGWLKSTSDSAAGPRARKEFTITRKGRQVLAVLRAQVRELHREVAGEE